MLFLLGVIDLAQVVLQKNAPGLPANQDKVENPSSWDNASYPSCKEKNGYGIFPSSGGDCSVSDKGNVLENYLMIWGNTY